MYALILLNTNKLRVVVNLPNDSIYKKLHIVLEFDKNDNVKTEMISDDPDFYTSMFYKEVIEPERDNEVWLILKKRYIQQDWIKKYIYFLLNAPTNIIALLQD